MRPLSYGQEIIEKDVKHILRILKGVRKDADRAAAEDAMRIHRVLGRVEGDPKRDAGQKKRLAENLRKVLTLLLTNPRTKRETQDLVDGLALAAKNLINDKRQDGLVKRSA